MLKSTLRRYAVNVNEEWPLHTDVSRPGRASVQLSNRRQVEKRFVGISMPRIENHAPATNLNVSDSFKSGACAMQYCRPTRSVSRITGFKADKHAECACGRLDHLSYRGKLVPCIGLLTHEWRRKRELSARKLERTTRIELATASLATMPRTLLASALLVGPHGIEPRSVIGRLLCH